LTMTVMSHSSMLDLWKTTRYTSSTANSSTDDTCSRMWNSLLWASFIMLRWKCSHSLNSQLLAKASALRRQLPRKNPPLDDELFFPSAYIKPTPQDPSNMRGFCNWIIPKRVMVGQYPGQVPEIPGPSEVEVHNHLTAVLLDGGVTCFVCLQSELPAQDDLKKWQNGQGQVFLDPFTRRDFPRPFIHYASIVDSILRSHAPQSTCTYLHSPIEDLSTPQESFSELLDSLLSILLEDDQACLYIHCWGGRGRAGLTASCLLSLLYPELDAKIILDHVQNGYDSRLGAEQMPEGLKQSPQTESQRRFVREFVRQCQAAQKSS